MMHSENPTTGRAGKTAKEIALNVGAVAGLICIIAAIAALVFGIKPLVFRSGSMGPTIQTGALGFAKTVPATELAVGDVVSVVDDQDSRITHRVDGLVPALGNGVQVTLKGDANEQTDLTPYSITEADRVFFHVNGLGYAVAWLSSPVATFLGGALVCVVLFLAFAPVRKRDTDDQHADLASSDDVGFAYQEADRG